MKHVTDIEGIGKKRAEQLKKKGISSIEDLSQKEPKEVAELLDVSTQKAAVFVTAARNSLSADQQIPTHKIILSIVAVALLIAAGIWATNILQAPDSYTYNGFVFAESDQCNTDTSCWQTRIQLNIGVRNVLFYYRPSQVEDVLVDPLAIQRVLNLTYPDVNGSVRILFDANTTGVYGVAASNLAYVTGQRIYNINTTGAEYGNPYTCDMASDDVFVYVRQGDDGVRVVDNCVVVSGSSDSILSVMDAYRLRLLQIIR